MDSIQADLRDVKVKAKQLRRFGFVPCVIYGSGLEESLSVQIPSSVANLLRKTKRTGSMVDVRVGEKRYHTLIKELDYNSIRNEIVHICFQVLEKGKKANGVADIVLLNRDKMQGVLEQIQMQVPHAAEPEFLLDTVTVDLEDRPVGTVITIGDIPEFQSSNIDLQTDPNIIVLRISEKKQSAEVTSDSTESAE